MLTDESKLSYDEKEDINNSPNNFTDDEYNKFMKLMQDSITDDEYELLLQERYKDKNNIKKYSCIDELMGFLAQIFICICSWFISLYVRIKIKCRRFNNDNKNIKYDE